MMKSEILSALRKKGDYVSGQELSEQFQVSRTAVWKKIKELQSDGYRIEAVPNRGYRIAGEPDLITAEAVESRLDTVWAGHPVIYLAEVASTNQYAKKISEEGAGQGTLVIADFQNQGKGRLGRTWTTPAGTAVAMSLVLRPRLSPLRIPMVTLVMGLAVTKACRELYSVPVLIKWPNDVVVEGRKLSGILTEMSTELNRVNYVVIGTGINVNVTEFPRDLRDKATSVLLETGQAASRSELAACCLARFEEYYEKFLQTEYLSLLMEEYNSLLINRGRTVQVQEPEGNWRGTALGIDREGCLLVEKEEGSVEKVFAGEVSVRGVYGYV